MYIIILIYFLKKTQQNTDIVNVQVMTNIQLYIFKMYKLHLISVSLNFVINASNYY